MKKIILGIFSVMFWSVSFAQQLEQFSMYMQNNFLINPAEAGTTDYTDVKLGYRTQWVGLRGAPESYFLTVHTPIGKKTTAFEGLKPLPHHGLGFAIIGDKIGAYERTTAKVSYAYQKPFSEKFTMSVGVHAGVQQFAFNTDFIKNARNPNVIEGMNKILPDLSLGLWGHTDKFYFGIASFNLVPSDISLATESSNGQTLKAHHWLTSGIRIPLDSDETWNLVPSFVVKYVSAAPAQVDVNTKLRFKDYCWLGVSYRHQDAAIGMVGVTFKSLIDISYAYDFALSNDRGVNGTQTHEILLGLRIPKKDAESAPPPFW